MNKNNKNLLFKSLVLTVIFVVVFGTGTAVAATVADITLPASKSDSHYNILYRESVSEGWQFSVVNLANSIKNFRIRGLKPGVKYEYTVVRFKKNGDTSVDSVKTLKTFNEDASKNIEKGKTYKAVGVSSVRVSWRFSSTAKSYNIYYRERGSEVWTHSVPNLSQTTDRYTIRGLNSRRAYVYKVTYIDKKGKEMNLVSERELKVVK